ncbi:sugar transporter SWEET1 isoform X2 [Syngnathus acus]|uniref:sugar transporter SWEET1 isoform X2 n=1 Tax=Syngnathus acus TaxID=161584 RepID=UPI0018861D09|nr:sugar transporter SWEET1 isoform X2 [Syngnathus acus]
MVLLWDAEDRPNTYCRQSYRRFSAVHLHPCILQVHKTKENGPVPSTCHFNGGDQRRVVLFIPPSGRPGAKPARPRLQHGHCGRVPVPPRRPVRNEPVAFLPFFSSSSASSCYSFTVWPPSPWRRQIAIVQSGNVQRLSFPLTVATFFTSTSWFLYGQQLDDYYVMVPNLPGILTSIIRFYLFWRFDHVSPPYKSMRV